MSNPSLKDSTDAAIAAIQASVGGDIYSLHTYRLLKPEDTIIEGDEYYSKASGCWKSSSAFGASASGSSFSYRRKVEPQEPKEPQAAYTLDATRPAAGLGYRRLTIGETIQEGDDVFFATGGWQKTGNAGWRVQGGSLAYRRKVEPQVTYRTLEVGETIQAGDEICFAADGKWDPVSRAIGDEVQSSDVGCFLFRRKVVAASGETCGDCGGNMVPDHAHSPSASCDTCETKDEGFGQVTNSRGMDPGPGYRLLKTGEIIEASDEFHFSNSSEWKSVVSGAVGYALWGSNEGLYRRKEVTFDWEAYAECLEAEVGKLEKVNDEALASVARHAESIAKLADRIVELEKERDEAQLSARNWKAIHLMAKDRDKTIQAGLKERIAELEKELAAIHEATDDFQEVLKRTVSSK